MTRRRAAASERGAILFLALVLAATFSLLGLALLAATEVGHQTRANGDALERADRAAAAGVEWAAAHVLANGRVDATKTLVLDDAAATVSYTQAATPQVVAVGRCRGAEARQTADLDVRPAAPLPYAYASFGSSGTDLDHDIGCTGSAYIASSNAFRLGSETLHMAGDLALVRSTVLPAGYVQHWSGQTYYGVSALAAPTCDTSPYASMTSTAAVPVHRYSGSTDLSGVTLDGVVVVNLEVGQRLTITNSTIRGTIVVRGFTSGGLFGSGGLLGTGLLASGGLLGTGLFNVEVRIRGTTTITGGTATTGNLAILAPNSPLTTSSASNATVSGVVLVYDVADQASITYTGQVIALGTTTSTSDTYQMRRPAGFVPNTPVGVSWNGPPVVRIQWRGR